MSIQLLWFIITIYEVKVECMNESLQAMLLSEVKCLKAKNVNLRTTGVFYIV